jgi:hypothetical protein
MTVIRQFSKEIMSKMCSLQICHQDYISHFPRRASVSIHINDKFKIYPKERESGYNEGTCTPRFIAELFTIAKLCGQPRCPLLMGGFRKCGMHIQGNLFSQKKNEILSFAGMWMELENITLSEVSQAQKAKGHTFSLICRIHTQYKCK